MRTSRLFSVLAIGTVLVAGMASLTPALSQTPNPGISYERTNLNINQVLVKLMAAGYDNIDKIEREGNAWEARAIDKNGTRVKLTLDPQTGDLLKPARQGPKQERRASEKAPA